LKRRRGYQSRLKVTAILDLPLHLADFGVQGAELPEKRGQSRQSRDGHCLSADALFGQV
jgi:hypothetical protein